MICGELTEDRNKVFDRERMISEMMVVFSRFKKDLECVGGIEVESLCSKEDKLMAKNLEHNVVVHGNFIKIEVSFWYSEGKNLGSEERRGVLGSLKNKESEGVIIGIPSGLNTPYGGVKNKHHLVDALRVLLLIEEWVRRNGKTFERYTEFQANGLLEEFLINKDLY